MFANGGKNGATLSAKQYCRLTPPDLKVLQHPLVEDPRVGRLVLNFANAMRANGFELVNDRDSEHYRTYKEQLDYLLEKNELLFKRREGSNFFVFAKAEKGQLLVHYSNPDSSEAAFSLKRKDVVRLRRIASPRQITGVITGIIETAAKKPKDVWILETHAHWGYINLGGKLQEIRQDDGTSPDRDIIRNLIFYNRDLEATGFHCSLVAEYFEAIRLLERSVGMLKIAATELTMPIVQGLTFKNGPHHLLYFATDEVAGTIQKTILEPKSSRLPGEAPDNVVYEKTLEQLRPYVERGEVAICVAHSAGALPGILSIFDDSKEEAEREKKPYGGRTSDCGVINSVASGALELKTVLAKVREMRMAIELYNLTVPHTLVEFIKEREKEKTEFWSMIVGQRKKFRGPKDLLPSMTQPALSMAFGFEMAERYGSVLLFGSDKHSVHPMDYGTATGAGARGWNEVKSPGMPTPPGVVHALLTGTPEIRAVVFAKLKAVKADGKLVISPAIIPEREGGGFGEKLAGFWNSLQGSLLNARDLILTWLRI
ncbi:MAG: hypothetical protein NT157_03060 [Candidatus Micrarchaeota archaeon]|nr:hypothetical protein [Candidatus Micrarchaeota archaeon]